MAVRGTKAGNSPTILSYGFRPFFLLGALSAGLAVLIWVPVLTGHLETASLFAPADWHVHELLFGYLAAVVTGFLLTAIPNWTSRRPVQGMSLGLLVSLWLAGRCAVYFSADLGWATAALIDCAFLLAVGATAASEIIAGRNWRNLVVLVPVAVLFAANVLFHLEAHSSGMADYGRRLGIAAAITLIMLIGGRIVPSFTRNWLTRENPGRLPVPFGRFDAVALSVSAAALACWVLAPEGGTTALLMLVAGLANTARLVRWAGWRTLRDPLVLILHVAYAFVPLGMFAAAAGAFLPDAVPAAAAIHIFSIGAIGAMTLAVMSRATLGHTGRTLRADGATTAIFAAIVLAVPLRLAAVFMPETTLLLHASACLWTLAFLGFAVRYCGMLVRPRLKAGSARAAAA